MVTMNSITKERSCLMEKMFVCVGLMLSVNESVMYTN